MNRKALVVAAVSLFSYPAWSQAEQTSQEAPQPSAEPSLDEKWDQAQLKVPPWTEPSGKGVGVGYQLGSWGKYFAQQFRIRIPVVRPLSVSLAATHLFGEPATQGLGGTLTVTGGTPVFLNLVRLYGGGAFDLLHMFFPPGMAGNPIAWGGGGFFGFEFFLSPRFSFYIEVGGRGGSHFSGATVMAGMNLCNLFGT